MDLLQDHTKTLSRQEDGVAQVEEAVFPRFEQLPLSHGDPIYSAWGLWGLSDELGTLHYLTQKAVKRAAKEILDGKRFNLNWELSTPKTPGFGRHAHPFTHTVSCETPRLLILDDSLTFNTQISSQWDGLRHFAYQKEQLFYNGCTKSEILAPGSGTLGIQNIASQGGIAGRGVLLDYYSYANSIGHHYNATAHHMISFKDLMACITYQEQLCGRPLEFLSGDILLIRTGYTQQYLKLTASEEEKAGKQQVTQTCGLKQDLQTLEWIWNHQFTAVAGDAPALEAFPPDPDADFLFHEVLLAGWGCPIGEMLILEDLSQWCKQKARWSFFVASSPLNVIGGVASPANMMAIM